MTTLKLKTNLRCGACVKSIKPLLDAEPGVMRWAADVSTPDKVLTIEGDGISGIRVGELLRQKGYEVVGQLSVEPPASPIVEREAGQPKTTYYPLMLILLYLVGTVGLAEVATGELDGVRAMRHFMGGFFLVFSFFKFLDVPAFAAAYGSYDIVARRWLWFGYVYPFIELALGAAYLANFQPVVTNLVTTIVMGIGTVGVAKTMLAQRKVRCACLGAVFNLPMSYVTLLEDLLMAGMAGVMLLSLGHG